VRERIRQQGRERNAPKDLVERIALIASELAHNHLAHAKLGYISTRAVERNGVLGMEVVAADLGPGIERPVPPDRRVSAGSLGEGLASVFRIADEVDFDSRVGEGACIIARKFSTATAHVPDVAILGRPYPGEVISGDDGVFLQSEDGLLAAVCDGLGHGPEARRASNQAIESVCANRSLPLNEIALAVNKAVADTRGCVLSLARFRKSVSEVECVTFGDTHAHLYGPRNVHFFTPTPVVLRGAEIPKRRPGVETVPVESGTILLMFTDGLSSKTSLKGQAVLLRQPAVAIAQHLIENNARATDDALVLVARIRC